MVDGVVGSNSTLEITSIHIGRDLKRNEPGLEDQKTGLKSYSVLEWHRLNSVGLGRPHPGS